MVTVYDVPAEQLILKTAQKLKENDKIVPPDWAEFVKTGRHTERAPSQDDWWYTRAASILRKLYVKGPIRRGLCLLPCQSVEKRAFSHIGEPHDA